MNKCLTFSRIELAGPSRKWNIRTQTAIAPQLNRVTSFKGKKKSIVLV